MKRITWSGVIICAFICRLVLANGTGEILSFELRNHWIVVQGTSKSVKLLNLAIDTGSSHSILDRKLVERLGLQPLGNEIKILAFGKRISTRRVVLAGLQLGSMVTSQVFLVADLSSFEFDAILGLDYLRRQNLSIDYQQQLIYLAGQAKLPYATSLKEQRSLITVLSKIQGESLQLIVDTASPRLILHQDRAPKRRLHGSRAIRLFHLSGEGICREFWLHDFQLGSEIRSRVSVFVLPERAPHLEWDGYLSPVAMGWARIHIDFEKNELSWKK